MTPVSVRHIMIAVVVLAALRVAPAAAQIDRPLEVFLGWAPQFADNPKYHVLPAWALSVSGGAIGPLSPVFDVSGVYFFHSTIQSRHSFLGGLRYSFPSETNKSGTRSFAQVLAGPTVFHAYGTSTGISLVPGNGVDLPVSGHRFAIRIQGDYLGTYIRGDYGRRYWGHLWRASTGFVFRPT